MYREVQRFRQWWLWAVLAGSAVFTLALGPVSWIGFVVVGVVSAFVYSLRLETEVRDDGIYVKMWPLHRSFRRISWAEIERYEAKRYEPIREFGGWGVRWAPGESPTTSAAIAASGSNGRTDDPSSSDRDAPTTSPKRSTGSTTGEGDPTRRPASLGGAIYLREVATREDRPRVTRCETDTAPS